MKIFCLRMMDYGYRVLILGDTKDEYEALCRALGVEPFVIGHGLPTRVNPLAIGPLGHGWADLDAKEAAKPRHRSCSTGGWCCYAGWSAHRRSAANRCRSARPMRPRSRPRCAG